MVVPAAVVTVVVVVVAVVAEPSQPYRYEPTVLPVGLGGIFERIYGLYIKEENAISQFIS